MASIFVSDLSQVVVDWAQVLGAAFGALALILALLTLRSAKRNASREARRQHELELLRDVGAIVGMAEMGAGDYGPDLKTWHELRTLLLLLKGQDDFALVRVAVEAHESKAAVRQFERRFGDDLSSRRAELERVEPPYDSWVEEGLRLHRLAMVARSPATGHASLLREELDAAIETRMA